MWAMDNLCEENRLCEKYVAQSDKTGSINITLGMDAAPRAGSYKSGFVGRDTRQPNETGSSNIMLGVDPEPRVGTYRVALDGKKLQFKTTGSYNM